MSLKKTNLSHINTTLNWKLNFAELIKKLNANNSVDDVVSELLQNPSLLTLARFSVGWRCDKNEEMQILAKVDSMSAELEILVFNALVKLNAFHTVDAIAEVLLRNSLFLACAQNSTGWRDGAGEERQVLAIVDAEIAMHEIYEILS